MTNRWLRQWFRGATRLARKLIARVRWGMLTRWLRARPRPPFVAAREGVRFHFNLADDVQRTIFLGMMERRDLALVLTYVRPGGVCLDVGANVGYYALHLARRLAALGEGGVVHAFEPDPAQVEALKANGGLNPWGDRVRVHAVAVGEASGTAALHRSDPAHSGWGSLVRFPDIAQAAIDVPVVSLDDFLEAQGIAFVDVMKVDVEAFEPELLAGARRSLARKAFGAVLIEYNAIRLAERGYGLEAILGPLEAAGYRAEALRTNLLAALRSGHGPSGVVTNFLFVP